MRKDYHPKPQNRPGLRDVPCVNEHGQRDVLLGMAQAGNNLAKQPLLIDNNWAKAMVGESTTTSTEDKDYISLEELRNIARKYKRKN